MAATKRQAEAITTHDQSVVVTAGAGTGKTFVLVQKYLDLLSTQGVSVPEVLALTFTEKAAAEMKERIRKELSCRKGRTWEKAVEDFMVAPVQTFHSFCAQVLREFPIEAGLEPGFVVLDERQESRIHARAFEELVHSVQPAPANEAIVHALSISGQHTLMSMLGVMYGKRLLFNQFFAALDEDETGVLASWTEEVHAFRDSEIGDLWKDPSFCSVVSVLLDLADRYEGANDRAAAYLGQVRPILEQLSSPPSTREFCCAAHAFMETRLGNAGSKKVWNEDDLADFKSARRNLKDILERKSALFRMTVDQSDPLITGSLQYLHELSFVFSRYTALVEQEKEAIGGLDFGDLVLNARRLFLEQGELVATHFMPRFRYILVDEFQDTDLSQFDIILSIIGTPTPETNCLFIVGDPKQSIYLFRDADVTRFKEAQRIILSACQGREVNLDTSFRSTKEVIGLTNHLFGRLFASAEKPWEFGYEHILASGGRTDHRGNLELLLAPGGEDSASSKRSEADIVARRISSLVRGDPVQVYEEQADHSYIQRPARFGDIAILLEQRTSLSYYLAAMSSYGVPFYVHGGTGFYSRQEVYDLYNLLRFLEYRHDDISLAGTLRSPYFGLPDTELFRIAQEKGRTLWKKLVRYAEKEGSFVAVRAHMLLAGWMSIYGRIGLVALIRRILSESGVYTVYAALPAGKQALANLEKMVAMARAREEAGAYDLADFTADLQTAMDEDEREGEAPLDALAENAVNIMTVHAAKGLEFPIVIVPDMGRPFRVTSPLIMIGDNPLLVGVKVPDPDQGYELAETPVLVALREMQRQKERAERKRLLYVALTRARDHLVMCGTAPANPGLSPDLAGSRIEWLYSALGITGDAVEAGSLEIPAKEGPVRLTITSDPASIQAETVHTLPELITVPEECADMSGTWTPVVFDTGPGPALVITVSELEKESSPGNASARHKEESRYLPGIDGALKGTIIHEVLRGRDPGVVCREHGVEDLDVARQCEEIVTLFQSTDLMQRVRQDFCELPFVITFEGKRVTGKIDRLCELGDGSWAVIDYKTEAVNPGEYVSYTKKYAVSMKVYREAAQQLLGGTAVTGWLYFTETGEFYRRTE